MGFNERAELCRIIQKIQYDFTIECFQLHNFPGRIFRLDAGLSFYPGHGLPPQIAVLTLNGNGRWTSFSRGTEKEIYIELERSCTGSVARTLANVLTTNPSVEH